MRFSFSEKDPKAINDKILAELGGRELGKMVNFDLSDSQLVVTISKLGTSKLVFDQSENSNGIEYNLSSEKIAMTHKAFKDDVKSKLCRVIEKCGGKVIEA